MTISDVASDLTQGQIAHFPRLAPRCACDDDDVIAYHDDDGDWTCTSCGRRLGARATDRLDAAQRPKRLSVRRTRRAPGRPHRIGARFDSQVPTA